MVDDHIIVRRGLDQDRIIVTVNAVDYRRLLAKEPVHPGLILLPNGLRNRNWRLIEVALAFLELQIVPADYMVNRVLEVSADEGIRPYELPSPDKT